MLSWMPMVMVAPTPLRRSTISPRIRGSPASLRNCLKSPVRSTQRNVLVCQASWTAKSERCIVTVVATMVAILGMQDKADENSFVVGKVLLVRKLVRKVLEKEELDDIVPPSMAKLHCAGSLIEA